MMEQVRICTWTRKGFLGWKNPHDKQMRKSYSRVQLTPAVHLRYKCLRGKFLKLTTRVVPRDNYKSSSLFLGDEGLFVSTSGFIS